VVGLAVGMGAGIDDDVDADADAAGAGGGPEVAIEVGTETIGSGCEEVGADAGLAASDGTGAAAISAVPAP